MLINDIITFLIDNGIQDFVLDSEFTEFSRDISIKGGEAVLISDVRSATFYAMGLSEKKNGPIVLLVRCEYLASSFTGLMEAWFQQRRLLVIAIGSKALNYSLDCYKSCSSGQYRVQNFFDFETYFKNNSQDRPMVFLVEEEIPYRKYPYCLDIVELEKEIPKDIKLYVYSPLALNKSERKNTIFINSEYKYGMISKFLGHCIFENNKSVLLTDSSMLTLEINIFNSRYIDQRFNLIVTGIKPSSNIIQWLKCNNIETVFSDTIEVAMKKVLQEIKPVVAFVETQEADSTCIQTL